MPVATAVADADAQLEYRIGDRWFGCVDRLDPDLLIGTMRRAQDAPTDQHDPRLQPWLTAVFTFMLAATDEAERDALVAHMTAVGRDPGALDDLADAFSAMLAAFTERQLGEVRLRIIENEAARAAALSPSRPAPTNVRRSSLADVERILGRYRRGSPFGGEVIRPGG